MHKSIYLGMPAVPADLRIEARWIVPMTTPHLVLDNHSLLVHHGRIVDILPSAAAAELYAATVVVERPAHLMMPGLVNAHTRAATSLLRGMGSQSVPLSERLLRPEFVRDGVLAAIAEMLQSGVTCFADRYYFPDQTARAASEQGIRAVIGMPVAETGSGPWAKTVTDYVTEGLNVRDAYKGHPLISTVFAPHAPNTLSDSTFARVVTLADELDAGIMIDLHESTAEISDSIAVHGARPIERLRKLGLLTPALNAVHMSNATAADIELAARTGISVSLSPQTSLRQGFGFAPVTSLHASGIRLGVGSGGGTLWQNQDTWGEMKLLALSGCAATTPLSSWDVLAMGTRGGGAVLGLDTDIGTLEPGKWADLCCLDLSGPTTQPLGDPVAQLVFCGGRDIVTDVWVAGRQLLADGELTRLDWPAVAARAAAWAARSNSGG